jgi:hypothetical protein
VSLVIKKYARYEKIFSLREKEYFCIIKLDLVITEKDVGKE